MLKPEIQDRLNVRQRPLDENPVMFQNWSQLLFLHWKMNPEKIQKTLPQGLWVDTFNGSAWVGIVPFFMNGVRPRYLPAVRGISNFLELNLRTYVVDEEGRPGVWFYSLDANQWLAVQIARNLFSLPYQYASMSAVLDGEYIDYSSTRKGSQTELRYHYKEAGEVFYAKEGSLDFFLAERYLLFSYAPRTNQIYTGRVYHTPYPLMKAEVSHYDAGLFRLNGLEEPSTEPDHVICSPGVEVEIFGLKKNKKG